MQTSERIRVSPILKPEKDSHQKWLDFTVQTIFREDKLTELYNDLIKSGEILPHIRDASINADGFLSQHAENGKYYCGQPVLSCECCDIVCGPTQGCNCDSCRAIQKHELERDKDRRDCPPLLHPPKSWFWKEEITKEHLEQYLFSLEVNQRNIIHEAMKSVKSFGRLNKRMSVLGRHLAAISYQCFGGVKKEETKNVKKDTTSNEEKTKEKVAEELSGYAQEVRNGIKTILSLFSKLMQRAWNRGEDSEICSGILIESLETLQKLPEAFLFSEGEPPLIWNEILSTSSSFLENVILGIEYQNVPIEDQRRALVLLYELAFQYGTLHQIIKVIIVSINLCICHEDSSLTKMPLGSILQRLRNLMKDGNQIVPSESESKQVGATSDGSRGRTQPGEEESNFYDLKVVTMDILRFLSGLTTLYAAPLQDTKEKDTVEEDGFKHELLFWGGTNTPSMPQTPAALCGTFVEIPIKQICITETQMILLTRYQRVYSFVVNAESLIFNRLVHLPARIQVTKIAAGLDGRHFLALTSTGEVYSWGNNDHGCLGVKQIVEGAAQSPIPGLEGKQVVHIACGSSYCAAVTEEGALYTWGSGEKGRLGHGSNTDCTSPTLVEKLKDQNVVDVACGSGDAHTLAVTADGRIWSWGDGKFGKLGRGTEDSTDVPELIDCFGSVTRASCGLDFSVCLTEDGKVWTWGRGDCYQLGHGNRENVLRPKAIEYLNENPVFDVAVGYNHVVAVTQSRFVFFWGSHERQVTDDVAEKTPIVVGRRSGSMNFGVAAGPSQTFCWSAGKARKLVAKDRFSIDVCPETFDRLNDLFELCDSERQHGNEWLTSNRDKICIYALKMLKLQLLASKACGLKPFETSKSKGPSAEALKANIIKFCSAADIDISVRSEAQSVLRIGWPILLPFAFERVVALNSVLAGEDGATVASRKRFVVDVLTDSLLDIGGLDSAIDIAVKEYSVKNGKEGRTESAVYVIGDFIELLLKIVTIDALERLSENEIETTSQRSNFLYIEKNICTVLRYQRLLFARLFKGDENANYWPSKGYYSELNPSVKAISILLKRYIQALVPCCKLLLKQGYEKVLNQSVSFTRMASFLLLSVPGVILREFLVLLTMAQNFAPAVASTSEGIPLLGELLDSLDTFNRSSKNWQADDAEDLSWSSQGESKEVIESKQEKTLRKISQEDLDQNTKQGSTWVAIHNKVYDLTLMKEQAPCAMLIEYYAGKDATSGFDSVHHSDEALAMLSNYYIGDFDPTLEQPKIAIETEAPKHTSVASSFLDSQRTLALILGLHAGYLSCGVMVTSEELDKKKWMESQLFSGGVESSAVLKDISIPDQSKMPTGETEFILEQLLYDCELSKPMQQFLENIKIIASQRDAIFSAIEFPRDHPIEKAVRAILAATLMHLDLEKEAISLSQMEISEVGRQNEKTFVFESVSKKLIDVAFSVYRQKLKIFRAHQEQDKSYQTICDAVIEKSRFVFYCLHSASGIQKREQLCSKKQLTVSRWQEAVQRLSVNEGTFWSTEKWWRDMKLSEVEQMVVNESRYQFDKNVMDQLLDFVCDENMILDVLRKCFLYQIKRVKQRLISGYMMQSYILRNGMIASARYSLLYGWMGMDCQYSITYRPKPGIANNIELVSVEEFVKLKSVFDIIAHWAVDLLKKKVRELANSISSCNDANEAKVVLLDHARPLTALIGMLTSQCHIDNIEYLVHSGIFASIQSILSCLEKARSGDGDITHPCPMTVVVDEARHHVTSIRNLTGAEIAKLMKFGTRVVRGPDWKWGDQDGPPPSQGRVISEVIGEDGWVRVQWDSSSTNSYRMGKDGKYDLKLAEPHISMETTDDDYDIQDEELIEQRDLNEQDLALSLLHSACITILQHTAILVGLKSSTIQDRTVRIVSGLFMKIIKGAYLENNIAFCHQNQDWTTLGILRLLCSSNRFRIAFSQPAHITTLLNIVKKLVSNDSASSGSRASSVYIQILILKLLGNLLPCVSNSKNEPFIGSVVHQLVAVLGDMLVRHVDFAEHETGVRHSSRHKRLQASVTASARGTIAEELILVIRKLFLRPLWDRSISYVIEETLEKLAGYFDKATLALTVDLPGQAISQDDATVVAVLAIIGGADGRVRLGGTVENEEHGKGIVTKITKSGKIYVQSCDDDDQVIRNSPLSLWRVVEPVRFDVDKMQNLSMMKGVLSSILHFAILTREKADVSKSDENSLNRKDGAMDCNLKSQQIELGLLVAARFLLPHSNVLSSLLPQSKSKDGGLYNSWLIEELFNAALKSNSVKSIYQRNEIETAALTLIEYLLATKYPLKEIKATSKKSEKHLKPPKRTRRRRNSSTRLPNPPLVVQQIVEMGFSRYAVEKALKEMGDESIRPEMIVTWLFDHPEITQDPDIEEPHSDIEIDLSNDNDSEAGSDYSETSSDSDCQVTASEIKPPYKTREDFKADEEYEEYVLENVKVGASVRFKDSKESRSEVGTVVKVFIYSHNKGSLEIQGADSKIHQVEVSNDIELVKYNERKIKVGDMVRVKASVLSPKYKWGAVNHSNIGPVTKISPDGVECEVDFFQQSGWTGLVSEMELAGAAHTGISCDGCHSNPICGPRFKCMTCFNFDLCGDCYNEMGNHRHIFYRYDEPGKSPQKYGKPPKTKSSEKISDDIVIRNFKKCIKDVWLVPDIEWHSTGMELRKLYRMKSKQKTRVCLEMNPGLRINRLTLSLDLFCPECILTSAVVSAGISMISMRKLATVRIDVSTSSVTLLENIEEEYKFIDIEINLCPACLAACKGNRLSIECSRKPSVRGIPATFVKFIAKDSQEELDRKLQRPFFKESADSAQEPASQRDSTVFVWGLNDKEQLGGMKGSKLKIPVLSLSLSALNCHQIVGGSKTIFAVSYNGKAYACGESTNGRLGLGPVTGNIAAPRQIEGLSSVFVKKIAVHSGGRHAMALTTDGRVYSWGEGEDGQLGHNNQLSYDSPKLVDYLDGLNVIEIAAGSSHSAAIVSEGDLYTWGLGKYGRLGHGDTETQLKPKMVKVLFGKKVTQISCGSRDAQTICLTQDGIVWSWGDGDFGKLGRGGSEGCLLPQKVERLNGTNVCKVLCGAQFSLALTSQGVVYTWGKGDFYRLGHGCDSHVRRPHIVESLKGKKIVDVAVGALHCLAVTDQGKVYGWGDNDHGQQGNGTVAANFRPAKVTGFGSYKITNVACGSSHSIAWADRILAPQMVFEPVPLKNGKDPLGMMYVRNEFEQKKAEESVGQLMRRLRSSLSKYVLELRTAEEKKKSLDLILESLRVCYARDALIKILGDLTRNAIEDADVDDESQTAEGTKSNTAPSYALYAKEEKKVARKEDAVLSLANVKLLVSLLKLGFSDRLNENQREELTMILIHNAKKDKEIAMTLLHECTTELEDLIANHELRKGELKPVIQESPHPYQGIRKISGRIRIPGADSLRIEFDMSCLTEYSFDILSIMCGNGRTLAMRSGSDPSYWTNTIKVAGDEILWKFTARSKGNLWGWRFTVYPETNECRQDLSCVSDNTVLAVPSIDLAKTFLSHDIEKLTGPGSHCNKLIFALSACAQLPSVSADDRCWIFRKLTKILISDAGPPIDVPGLIGCGEYRDDVPNIFKYKSTGDANTKEVISSSPLGNLIRGLPDALKKQYDSESKNGQNLFYSSFLRALVTLGRTLGLDYLMCCSDTHHWGWFTKYCMVYRVTESIINRTPLPKDFLFDVRSRIQEISQGEEGLQTDYENHSIFTDEEDKQALNWIQRHPRDWFLSLRGNGNIYGWGHNHRGQLGGLDGSRIKSPQACENLSSLHPVQICGGEQTLFCLSEDGKIHSTGYGNGGRLGVGGMATITVPRVIESLQHVVVKKIAVHSGGKHCLALTSDGEIFSWGEGDDGKLGHGNRLSSERPRVIEKLLGTEIIDIACGGSHSAAISAAGELYTWGKGRYGRLGHGEGETEDQLEPKLVEALEGFKVIDIACGSGDAQTLCITDNDYVWSWGDGDFGKLGRGGSDGCKLPTIIDDLIGVGIIKVECGSQFSLALSNSGLVYTWGKGDYYRLGHGSDDHVRRPKVVAALEGKKVVSVACGSLHCVVCTDRGEVYTWGDNDEGQLGDGTTNAVHKPSLIQSLMGKKIDHVACGSAHTIAWSTVQAVEPCRLPKEIPTELTKLQNFSIRTIRNRLLLLYQFSDLFWSALPLLDLDNNTDGSLFSERNIELLRSSLTSASKDSAFRKIINNTMVRDHQHGPIIDLNRVSVKSYRRNGGLAGRNGSKSVFAQACSKMSLLRSESLFLPHRVWKVKFIGESVDDCGGGYSESIAEMCEELQNGSLPLLIPTPDSRDEVEGVQKSFLLNPFARSQIHNDMFKFLGILIGIAIRTGSPLALNLAEPVWKQLSGVSLSIEDIIEIDRGFLSRLNYVRELDLSDDGIELPFTVLSSNNTEIELLEKYSKISNENRNEYLKLVLQYRLHEFDQQVAAVREGIAKVVPAPLLVFYSGIELETMVCGSPHIPVDSLKAITSYKNIDVNEPLVVWFWEVIEEFTSLERSLFLRFVWGRARLPRTAADFRGRDFVFQVLDKFSPPNLYLPESYTCFFMLKMPRYTNKATLRDKLKYAIHFCKSIDSDEYARVDLTGDHVNT